MNIKLVGARVLVDTEVKNESEGGIIIPESKTIGTEQPVKAKVIAVGPGAWLENGTRVPTCVAPGNTVMIQPEVGFLVTEGDKEYRILNDRDIICVIEE